MDRKLLLTRKKPSIILTVCEQVEKSELVTCNVMDAGSWESS